MSSINDNELITVGVFRSPKLSLSNASGKFKDVTVGINTLPSTFVKAKNKKIEWYVVSIKYTPTPTPTGEEGNFYTVRLGYCINGNKNVFDAVLSLTTNDIGEPVIYPVYSGFPGLFTFQTTTAMNQTASTYRSSFSAYIAGGKFESLCEFPINPDQTNLFNAIFTFSLPISGGTGPDVVSFGLPEEPVLTPSPIPTVSMSFTLDSYGSNLSEILCWVTGNNVQYMRDYAYPNDYAGATIGASVYETKISTSSVFSFRPCFQKAMKGEGKYLIERARSIWSMYKVPLEFSLFYKRLTQFMTDRYFLAGLSSQTLECDGFFSTTWLLQSNTEEFMRNLECSDFAPYKYLFTDQYLGYDKYMLEC
jgi:hypothetical protein